MQNLRALFIFVSILFSLNASAQLVYFNSNTVLWSYNIDTQVWANIGSTQLSSMTVGLFDIGAAYNGQLYGLDPGGTLYKINRTSAQLTHVGATGVYGNAMTFVPDGTAEGALYVVGTGGGCAFYCLFKVNPLTAAAQLIGTVNDPPSGDLGYNLVDQKLYMSTAVGGDYLVEVNMNTGSCTNAGSFGAGGVWAMDFTDRNEKVIGLNSASKLIILKKVGASTWAQESIVNAPIPGYGAAKYHCVSHALLMLNGSTAPTTVTETCGDHLTLTALVPGPPVSTGAPSNIAGYELSITGPDASGSPITQTISGAASAPGVINLLTDPRFSAFNFAHTLQGAGLEYQITFTVWCDLYEPPAVQTMTLKINPITLAWDIKPESEKGPIAETDLTTPHQYYFNTLGEFLDTGTPLWQSGEWLVRDHATAGAQLVGTGLSTRYLWEREGLYDVTYKVHHQNGCISEETKPVKILNDEIYIPNAFTPNGDGLNDVFKPVLSEMSTIEDAEMSVYDRWGERIFYGTGISGLAWDGNKNGHTAELGVYNYVIQLKIKHVQRLFQGTVTIIQ